MVIFTARRFSGAVVELLGSMRVKVKTVYSLLCHCPPWKPPGAGRRTASPQCGAAPSGEVMAGKVKAALKTVLSAVVFTGLVLITWWSLSFSSQMIFSTSLLLSFLTVCTSAEVDRCCSQKHKHREGSVSKCQADTHPQHLSFTRN